MKSTIACLLILVALPACHAQVYDLIVTKAGDSIACRIERIEDPSLYFGMIYNNAWISTSIPLNEVVSYEYDSVHRKDVILREGTSYIESLAGPQVLVNTVYELQKNSVYLTGELVIVSLDYERLFPFSDRAGLLLSAGISPGIAFTEQGFFMKAKAALRMGKPRHAVEIGVLSAFISDFPAFIFLGYRYQANKGFLLRAGLGINPKGDDSFYLLPEFSLGYSF